MTTTAKGNLRPSLEARRRNRLLPIATLQVAEVGGCPTSVSALQLRTNGCRNRPAGESPHSNPWTGGESQLGFALDAGLGGTAKTLCAVACFSSALLERATAERCAILP